METLVNGFKTNRAFAVTSLLVLLLLAIALAAPIISPFDPTHAEMKDAFLEPSMTHLFGTDKLGRDCFSRVLYGARASLTGVLVLVASVFLVGTTMGVLSGYFGGKVDIIIMRFSDMMISFPGMILAIAIAGIMGGSLVNAVIALTIVSWTKYARLARSMVLKVKRRDYVEAAIVNGGTPPHILWVHILPNILPEWGLMLNEGRQQLQTAPWLMIFPGLAIFVTVVVFNLWGDNLRDVLDPRNDVKD